MTECDRTTLPWTGSCKDTASEGGEGSGNCCNLSEQDAGGQASKLAGGREARAKQQAHEFTFRTP